MRFLKFFVVMLITLFMVCNISFAVNADGYTSKESSTKQPLTPAGNVRLEDDIQTTESTEKQFITVVTKNGNYFYIIIDRDNEGKENVHFLNQVDESDLMAILEKDDSSVTYKNCICPVKCSVGKVDTVCPVCILKMESCQGIEKTDTQEPETKDRNTDKSGRIILILILTGSIGGAGYFLYRKLKKQKENNNFSVPDEFFMYDDDEDEAYTDALEEFSKEKMEDEL